MSDIKPARYGGRLPQDLRRRLDAVNRKHITNDSAVIHALLEAFCDEAERIGAVRLPITLRMAESTEERFREVAEPTSHYAPPDDLSLPLPAETAVKKAFAHMLREKKPTPEKHK